MVLAASEAATDVPSWRNPTSSTGAYLRFLADQGYTLSDVERLAAGLRDGDDQREDGEVVGGEE